MLLQLSVATQIARRPDLVAKARRQQARVRRKPLVDHCPIPIQLARDPRPWTVAHLILCAIKLASRDPVMQGPSTHLQTPSNLGLRKPLLQVVP
jgi:hypothetical protein